MTQKEFDEYRFSIHTQVNFCGEWYPIKEVWFDEGGVVAQEIGQLDTSEVEDIRELINSPETL